MRTEGRYKMAHLTPLTINGIKKSKKEYILNTLLKSGGITRQQLAKECGMSAMTAGKVVCAMLESGYASSKREPNESGTFTDVIYPDENFKFLIFDIREDILRTLLYNIREDLLFCYSQPRNSGISQDIDILNFIKASKAQFTDLDEDPLCKSAVICSGEANRLDNICEKCDVDLIVCNTSAVIDYVRGVNPEGTVFYINVDHSADNMLISNGMQVTSKTTPIRKTTSSTQSEFSILEQLSARLSDLFQMVIPEQIIIEGDSLCINRRFANELSDTLSLRCRIEKEKLPEIITNDGIDFASRAVIGQLIDMYSKALCGE